MPTKEAPVIPSLADLLAEIDAAAALRAIGKMKPRRSREESDEYLTRAQVSELFHVTLRTVDKWCQRGVLRPYKVRTSRLTRFKRQDVLDALQLATR